MGTFLLLFLVLFPMAASPLVYAMRSHGPGLRDHYIRLIPALELAAALGLLFQEGAQVALPGVAGVGMTLTGGSLRTLLVVLAAVLWQASALAGPSYFHDGPTTNRYYLYWLLTEGALMGVFLAGDLFTLFVFFEMMSFASYVWVAHNETEEALKAAETYLAIAVIGGMALLSGLLLLHHLLDTLTIGQLRSAVAVLEPVHRTELYVAGALCLVGFGAKAGMFPLHIWLPKAHPVAPAPASALLSGILTKSGVFGALIVCRELFWTDISWNRMVLILAVITMALGAVLAVFSVDLKRTLACSSMSQIGFIMVGTAMQGYLTGENALASLGTVLHMMNHSLIKMVLFISAGVIYLGTHSLNLNDIRGWGRDKPWLKAAFFCGAASIAGIPGFSGYVSKTLLHESIVEYIHHLEHIGESTLVFRGVEWIFLISGGLTAAYMTKLFICIFVEQKAEGQHVAHRPYMPAGVAAALTFGAALMLVLGLTPNHSMEPLAIWATTFLHADPMAHGVHYFIWINLKGACISLTIGALVYLLVIRRLLARPGTGGLVYRDRWPEQLDLEFLVYRPFMKGLAFLGALCARALANVGDSIIFLGERLLFAKAPGIFVPKHADFGTFDRKPRRFLVGESFTFDLLVACAGVILVLVLVLLF